LTNEEGEYSGNSLEGEWGGLAEKGKDRTLDYPLVGLRQSLDKILEISWTRPKVFFITESKEAL
jgi:hypothetical protein